MKVRRLCRAILHCQNLHFKLYLCGQQHNLLAFVHMFIWYNVHFKLSERTMTASSFPFLLLIYMQDRKLAGTTSCRRCLM